MQPLLLKTRMQAYFISNPGILVIERNRDAIWLQVITVMLSYKFLISLGNDAEQKLSTNWGCCKHVAEDNQY